MSNSKLLNRVRAAVRARHYSTSTEEAYISWIRRYVHFHDLRHPSEMGEEQISQFLTDLAVRGHVSAATQNQAASALIFLYRKVLSIPIETPGGVVRAKKPKKLPVVLTRREARAVLAQLRGVHQLVAALLYGSGLRLMEALRLRVKDVDLERGEIVVRGGKGGKDRMTMLPLALHGPMRAQVEQVRQIFTEDLKRGGGYVTLPDALERKSPADARALPWQFLFPASRVNRDAQTDRITRYHLHPTAIQRCVKDAVRAAGS